MSTHEQKNPDNVKLDNVEYKYAILQETSGEEMESWLYFIRYQGNEESLTHLSKQLEQVDWYIVDDLSTFDLELNYLVSEKTAKEMTKVDLNHYSFHRKFDGKLKSIDLGLKEHYNNVKKMSKVFDVLGYGKIEDFIDMEDIDPEDLVNVGSDFSSEDSTDTDDTSCSESDEESESERKNKKQGKMPNATKQKIDVPRIAKIKAEKRKNKK
jgi:hypothetical protein